VAVSLSDDGGRSDQRSLRREPFDSNAVHASVSTTYSIFGAISRRTARPFLGHSLKL
jgi:hypothetical protein